MDFKMVLFSANKNEFVFIFLFLENKNIVMSHEWMNNGDDPEFACTGSEGDSDF